MKMRANSKVVLNPFLLLCCILNPDEIMEFERKVYKGDILLSSLVSVSITSVPRMLRKVIHLGFFPQNQVLESVMGFQERNLG